MLRRISGPCARWSRAFPSSTRSAVNVASRKTRYCRRSQSSTSLARRWPRLACRSVARNLHRRLHTNNVYTAYGISLLTGRDVIEQLQSKGITEAFDPAVARSAVMSDPDPRRARTPTRKGCQRRWHRRCGDRPMPQWHGRAAISGRVACLGGRSRHVRGLVDGLLIADATRSSHTARDCGRYARRWMSAVPLVSLRMSTAAALPRSPTSCSIG